MKTLIITLNTKTHVTTVIEINHLYLKWHYVDFYKFQTVKMDLFTAV